jgi:hypothetical protein
MLGAVAVLGLGGKTDLTPGFVQHHGANSPLYCKLLQKVPDYATDLGTIYGAATRCPRVLLAYSAAHEIDRQQAERMAGLSSVELIAVGGQPQHNVIDPLIRRREFFPLLHRLMAL